MSDTTPADLEPLGQHYAVVRRRLGALVDGMTPTEVSMPVPACPGWSVHDVIAHLVGVVEDAMAGRLTAPPDETQTDEQVTRHRGDDTRQLVTAWHEMAPAFEEAVTALQIVPALIDVMSHELDVLAAFGRPAPPAGEALDLVATWLAPDTLPVTVIVDGRPLGGPERPCALRTTSLGFLRFRLGRCSRNQALALDWTRDPSPVLDDLFVFGPAAIDLADFANFVG